MKVLIATEGSEFSKAAIDKFCAWFVRSESLEIKVISVAIPALVPAEPWAVSADYIREIDEAAKKEAENIALHSESVIRESFMGVDLQISSAVVTGSAERMIVEEAENWGADLIVTGSHGRGFWQRALLGSVSSSVVHHAPCSVLIVRNEGY